MPTMAELVNKKEVSDAKKEANPHLILHELSNVKMFVPRKQKLNFVPWERSRSGMDYYHKGICLGVDENEKKIWFNVHYYNIPAGFFGRNIRAKVQIVRLRTENGVFILENVEFQGNQIDKTNKVVVLDDNPDTGFMSQKIFQYPGKWVVVRKI